MSNPFQDPASNPYAATTTLETQAALGASRSYGGIGRAAYFGFTFFLNIVYQALLLGAAMTMGEGATVAIALCFLGFIGVLLWIVSLRMINMGYSPWWCLGFLVPILNILVGLRALVCPEGYADHKTLDTAGKVIAGIFLALVALAVLLVVFAAGTA